MGKKDINKDFILEQLEAISLLINAELEKSMISTDKNKSTKILRKVSKRVERLKKELPRMKNKTSRTDYSSSGFIKKTQISDELADFLHVDRETAFSRDEIQCALSVYINLDEDESREKKLRWGFLNIEGRDLRDPENRKLIIPNKELSNLLNYPAYQKRVSQGKEKKRSGDVIEDDGLYFHTLTKLIQPHFRK